MRTLHLPARMAVGILVLATLTAPGLAQQVANGVIAKITPNEIVLVSGESYRFSRDVSVILPGEREGRWADLQAGDRIRVTLGSQKQVSAVTVTGKASNQRILQSLLDNNPIEGNWKTDKEIPIRGRIFDAGAILDGQNDRGRVIFKNSDDCDLLEVWIGSRDGAAEGPAVFRILGDGEEIYRSPKLGPEDPAIKVEVSVKGYSGITLISTRVTDKYMNAVWANPVFVKLPPAIPVLVSPGMNERITQDTPLVWKPVMEATGYLLELQCERLANTKDSASDARFTVLRLPAKTTVYNFETDRLPKGKWRWRVHSLSETGFLGQSDSWRVFLSE